MAKRHYKAKVFRWNGAMDSDGKAHLEEITSGVEYYVLAKSANTFEVLYDYRTSTSKNACGIVDATEFAADGGMIKFTCDPTDSTTDLYVDLIVRDNAGGFTQILRGFSPYQQEVVIDERRGVEHVCIQAFNAAHHTGAINAEWDTGVDFKVNTAIRDCLVECITVDNTETIGIGTADTAAGFRTGVALATGSEGLIQDTAIITGGSTIDYTPATNYGTLLATAITGSDVVATVGGISYKKHLVKTSGTDDDLYMNMSTGSDTAVGFIYLPFTVLR